MVTLNTFHMKQYIPKQSYGENKDYFITGRANVIFCAVGLR